MMFAHDLETLKSLLHGSRSVSCHPWFAPQEIHSPPVLSSGSQGCFHQLNPWNSLGNRALEHLTRPNNPYAVSHHQVSFPQNLSKKLVCSRGHHHFWITGYNKMRPFRSNKTLYAINGSVHCHIVDFDTKHLGSSILFGQNLPLQHLYHSLQQVAYHILVALSMAAQ